MTTSADRRTGHGLCDPHDCVHGSVYCPVRHAAAIDLFLTTRPHYSPDHVAEIAQSAAFRRIPFCTSCADWHEAHETCSD